MMGIMRYQTLGASLVPATDIGYANVPMCYSRFLLLRAALAG